ncbi:MAG: PEFG-CTERM sorting domain-containing protein [Candidatus Poseidoniia archaeon]|nr:PEFG-CTERM sorting domain-containing protein [Candidatus Poseidoniia archaeon]
MQKKIYSLFGLLAIFSLIAIAPPAFADHTTAEVDMAVGSSVVGCETTNECYIPHMVTIDVGGEVMWNNIDAMAHTVTAGTPTEGLSEHFDSGLVAPGAMFSHTFDAAGTFDYFCMVHPWMVGAVMVSSEETHGDMEEMEGMKEMGHSDDHAAKGIEDLSDQFTTTLTSGVIHHIGGNTDDATLLVHLFGADDDGKLEITLNSDIITPFDDGSYFVLVDGQEVEFMQMDNTLHIEYDAGAEKIEIVGSHVVPEFGTIAMIVLAVAIVSIIVLTTKTRTTLIPKL